jgi:predicted nucleic acid-binding protein
LKVYADTSFLASLYAKDAHSAEAGRKVRQDAPSLFLTPLLELELVNALQLRVFRREAQPDEIHKSATDLEGDIRARVFEFVPLPPETYDLARQISARRTAASGARTLNILHVACATLLKADRFWTFDTRQSSLARAEGLRVR